eukprot:7430819-Heterocapsa_arctica.AAC.1
MGGAPGMGPSCGGLRRRRGILLAVPAEEEGDRVVALVAVATAGITNGSRADPRWHDPRELGYLWADPRWQTYLAS